MNFLKCGYIFYLFIFNYGYYFLKPQSFCVSMLFFHQKSAKFKINCRIMNFSWGWLILNARFFAYIWLLFRWKSVKFVISHDLQAWNVRCFFFCINMLFFRLIVQKYDFCNKLPEHEVFPQLITFKSTIILCTYTIVSPKTGKMCDILQLNSEFPDRPPFNSW